MPPASVGLFRPNCLVCLKPATNVATATISPDSALELFQFLEAYLKTNWEDNVPRAKEKLLNGRTALFCEKCGVEVSRILEAWKELEKLRMQLLWRVGQLGEVIRRSEATSEGDREVKLEVLAKQLGFGVEDVAWFRVLRFRREVAKNCFLKARRILPKVKLRRENLVCKKGKLENDKQQQGRSVEFLAGFIIIYGLNQNWNLYRFRELVESSSAKFVEVSRGAFAGTKVPSRWTLNLFCRLFVMLSLSKDWNLVKILEQYKLEDYRPMVPIRKFVCRIKVENCETAQATGETEGSEIKSRSVKRKVGRPVGWRRKKPEAPLVNTDISAIHSEAGATEKRKGRVGRPFGWRKRKRRFVSTSKKIIKSEPGDQSTGVPSKRPGRPFGWRKKKPENSVKSQEIFTVLPQPGVSGKVEENLPILNPTLLDDHEQNWDDDSPMDNMPESPPALEPELYTRFPLLDNTHDTEDAEAPVLTEVASAPVLEPSVQGKWSLRRRTKDQISKMIEDNTGDAHEDSTESSRKKIKIDKTFSLKSKKKRIRIKLASGTDTKHKITKTPPSPPKLGKYCHQQPTKHYSASYGFFMKCPDCSATFLKALRLEDHFRNAHSKTGNPITCQDCSKPMKDYHVLMEHVDQRHEKERDKPHFCFYCTQSFATLQMRSLHLKNLHWIFPQELFCEVESCPEKYEDPRDLAEHLKSHSSDSSGGNLTEVHTCDKCQWPFLSDYLLRLHKFNHLKRPGVNNCFQCDRCHHKSRTSFDMINHFNEKHATKHQKITLYTCDLNKSCRFYFTGEKYLEAHRKLHEFYEKAKTTPPGQSWTEFLRQEKAYSCMYCNNEFVMRKVRSKHELMCPEGPSEEKKKRLGLKYCCHKCDFGTESRAAAERHMTTHVNPAFECPHCDRSFKRMDNRDTHVVRVHTKAVQLVCHLCGRVCPNKWELKYHLKEHERQYMCPDCGKRFSRGWLLKVHSRTHNGDRLQCEFCPELFRTYEMVRKHLQKVHPEEYDKNYDGKSRRRTMYKVVSTNDTEESGRKRKTKDREHGNESAQTDISSRNAGIQNSTRELQGFAGVGNESNQFAEKDEYPTSFQVL